MLFAPSRFHDPGVSADHEGRAGLYLGYLLDQPAALNFTFSANRESFVWQRTEQDFRPTRLRWRDLAAQYGTLRTLYIEAVDTTETAAADPVRPLIVHCHGNSSNLYNNATYTALSLLPFGDVLQFEYPGFDKATAKASGLRRIANFDPMVATLAKDLNAQAIERPLLFWGHSLGGLICAELAAVVEQTDGLILEATGASAESIVQALAPKIAGPFVRYQLDDRLSAYSLSESLRDFDQPVLVLGAKQDKTLPVRLSQEVFATLKAEERDVSYAEFPQANHLSVKAQPSLGRTIEGFLQALINEPSS